MTEDDLNHKSAYEDNFLMSYQGLHSDSNDGNRDVSLKQGTISFLVFTMMFTEDIIHVVNYLRISVLKSYRKTLRDTQRQSKPPIENLRELTNMPVDIFFEVSMKSIWYTFCSFWSWNSRSLNISTPLTFCIWRTPVEPLELYYQDLRPSHSGKLRSSIIPIFPRFLPIFRVLSGQNYYSVHWNARCV